MYVCINGHVYWYLPCEYCDKWLIKFILLYHIFHLIVVWQNIDLKLYFVHCGLYIVDCILWIVLYIVYCILYIVYYILFIALFAS